MKITRILLIITTLFLLIWYFINQYKLLWRDGESNFIPNKLEAPIETITINGVSFKMVKVEGGTFRMGRHLNKISFVKLMNVLFIMSL